MGIKWIAIIQCFLFASFLLIFGRQFFFIELGASFVKTKSGFYCFGPYKCISGKSQPFFFPGNEVPKMLIFRFLSIYFHISFPDHWCRHCLKYFLLKLTYNTVDVSYRSSSSSWADILCLMLAATLRTHTRSNEIYSITNKRTRTTAISCNE